MSKRQRTRDFLRLFMSRIDLRVVTDPVCMEDDHRKGFSSHKFFVDDFTVMVSTKIESPQASGGVPLMFFVEEPDE